MNNSGNSHKYKVLHFVLFWVRIKQFLSDSSSAARQRNYAGLQKKRGHVTAFETFLFVRLILFGGSNAELF